MENVRVVSNWHHLLDGFQHSPQAFFTSLDAALAKRKIPDSTVSRVELAEGPVLSARREYLRVRREEFTFDVCAAPFGSGFFVSWWLVKPSHRGLFYAILLALLIFTVPAAMVTFGVMVAIFGFFFGLVATAVLVVVAIGALGYAVRRGVLGIEDEVLALPVIGAIYDWIFKPFTYYRMDTARMFESAVHGAVMEAVDELTTTKGIRALSEFERKPIMRELSGRRVA